MNRNAVRLGIALLALAFAGCGTYHYPIMNPLRNRTLRVEEWERFYFVIDDRVTAGGEWSAECSDPDVVVTFEHTDSGSCRVRIRIEGGFDGPSSVTFTLRDRRSKREMRSFTYLIYKRTGNTAFWK